ncbi:MAG TPA: hypothetical protein VNN80_23005 [Polyangiaceae bacterium]|nr:hypothetical protein [Polyangiaceae bacterium]
MRINLTYIAGLCALAACGGGDAAQSAVSGLTGAGQGGMGAGQGVTGAGQGEMGAGQGVTNGTSANPPAGGDSAGDDGEVEDPEPPLCDAAAPRTLLTGVSVSNLNADEDFVYFIDTMAGPSLDLTFAGAVKRVAIASGEVTTLFEPSEPQPIRQLLLLGSDLFLFMAGTGELAEVGFLYRLPVTGGTPTLVGPQGAEGYSLDGSPLAAVNERAAYMVGASRADLYEITLADGSERVVGSAEDISRPQLLGDTLYYATEDGLGDIFSVDASVAGAEPVLALAGGCGQGSITGSSYQVIGDEVLCGGFLSVGKYPLGAGEPELGTFWGPPLDLAGGEIAPARFEDGEVYVVGGRFAARVPVAGGDGEFFACEGMTLDALTTNSSSIIWGRGGFSVGFVSNQVVGPSVFSEVVLTPK